MPFSFHLCLWQMMLSYWHPGVSRPSFSGNFPLQTDSKSDNKKQAESPAHSPLAVLVMFVGFFWFSPISLKVLADVFIFFLLGSGTCQCCSLEEVSLLQNWVGKHRRKLYLWAERQNRLFCTDLTLPAHVSIRIKIQWNGSEEIKITCQKQTRLRGDKGECNYVVADLKASFYVLHHCTQRNVCQLSHKRALLEF